MVVNSETQEAAYLLLAENELEALRLFFSTWDGEEELIDKVMIWCHMFMEEYFRDPSPSFHRDLIKMYFSKKNEYAAAPRGFSKTTLFQGCACFEICNRMEKFLVFVEKSFAEASEVLNGIYNEFVDNKLIHTVYGNLFETQENIVTSRKIKARDKEGDFVVNGVRVKGRGFEKTIRGLKDGAWRPTKIVLDDVESDEHINNPDQRRKYLDNLNKSLIPALDPDYGRLKMFGTILHIDSLLSNKISLNSGKIYRAYYTLDQDDDYDSLPYKEVRYQGKEYKLLWPERWTMDKLLQKKEEMRSKNVSSSAFAQEYLNNPIAEEERQFKAQWLWNPQRQITMAEFLKKKDLMHGYCAIDMADSTKEGADYTGCIVEFIDFHGNYYRPDVRREKRNINGVIDLIFEIWNRWRSFGLLKIGIEKRGFEDQILPMFEMKKKELAIFPLVEELKTRNRNKENRIIGALQGKYEYGRMWDIGNINKDGEFVAVGDTEVLKNELYNFPNDEHDDLADAEAYIEDMAVAPMRQIREGMNSDHLLFEPDDDPWDSQPAFDPYL